MKLRISVLVGALVLVSATPSTCAPLPSDQLQHSRSERANWKVRTAWVKELEPDEQIVVLLLIRSALNKKLFELIEHNGDRKGEDFRWIIGTQAWGNYMLSLLATKDEEARKIFTDVSDRLLPVYLGEQPLDSYVDFSNQVTRRLESRASKIDLKRANETAANFRDSIERASSSTIVTAMLASSSGLKKDSDR